MKEVFLVNGGSYTDVEAKSTEERLLNIAYSNAHKKLKHRADTAMEMMNSCKKILTSRIVEKQLSLNKEKIED